MSKHLDKFFEEWAAKARRGAVSDLGRIEVMILELYDEWLEKKGLLKIRRG